MIYGVKSNKYFKVISCSNGDVGWQYQNHDLIFVLVASASAKFTVFGTYENTEIQ